MATRILRWSVVLSAFVCSAGCGRGEWGRIEVELMPGGRLTVTLENSIFLARYGIGRGGRKGHEWAFRDLIIKAFDEDQAGKYIDACATRGFLAEATIVRDEADIKTVRLRFDDGLRQDISIFPDKPYLRIDYGRYGVNVVDIGSPGGGEGQYEIYGADKWHRRYELYPNFYYNRYRGDVGGENMTRLDVEDGGPLAYKGHFIMGVYNPANGRGFGRVAPVRHVDIVKLLFNRGFELFAHYHRPKRPYTSYLYVVTAGATDVISTGKAIVDEAVGP